MTMRNTTAALATMLALSSSGIAYAHPGIERREAVIGAPYKAVVRIPHGCEGSATTRVRIVIPEGLIGVKPMPKPGWVIEAKRGAYAEVYPYYHGAMLKEGVREIVWSGRLADEHVDEFVFFGFVAKTLSPGGKLHLPVYQDCESGSHAWVEIPAAGQASHDLKSPALMVQLTQAAPSHDHMQGSSTYKAGGLMIEMPWSRATPGGAKVAAGFVKVTNNGTTPDRLTGGTLAVAKEVEVHEMAMVDQVMRMRRIEKGLEIKPGETVELKPSGYHLMFFNLARPIKEGETIKGTLVFERAGEVAVEFRVNAIGAQPSGHGHH